MCPRWDPLNETLFVWFSNNWEKCFFFAEPGDTTLERFSEDLRNSVLYCIAITAEIRMRSVRCVNLSTWTTPIRFTSACRISAPPTTCGRRGARDWSANVSTGPGKIRRSARGVKFPVVEPLRVRSLTWLLEQLTNLPFCVRCNIGVHGNPRQFTVHLQLRYAHTRSDNYRSYTAGVVKKKAITVLCDERCLTVFRDPLVDRASDTVCRRDIRGATTK